MGVKSLVKRVAEKSGDRVAKLATLSPEQVQNVQLQREKYLFEMPNLNDEVAQKNTERLLAASSIEIFNAFLPQIKDLYLPINREAEYGNSFDVYHNIRYFNITKWVTNKQENSLEKLVNVYAVLSNEDCNIALVFNRSRENTDVYLAVVNTKNTDNNVEVDMYKNRLLNAIKGNFPGSELKNEGIGVIPCLNNEKSYSVASASNIPTEKSEKFISQTIEKLLDGIIPDSKKKEYTIILLATPIRDVEDRKLKLGEFYSGMAPYASWQTNFTYSENNAIGSLATVGVNIGASAGIQNGQNYADTTSNSITDSNSVTDSESQSLTNTEGTSDNVGGSVGGSIGVPGTGVNTEANYGHGWNRSKSETIGKTVSKTLGRAVTNGVAKTVGTMRSVNLGGNFGANFARSSTVTATIGKNEGITQSFTNFNIKHALELLENQMKRLEQSTALGMWDFAAYVLSEDQNVANNVAHTYLALTLGEESYMSKSAINLWRGNIEEEKDKVKEICSYLKELRHPIFAINPEIINDIEEYNVYPSIVTATTSLSGKELAYSLNFPQKSIAGLPILECAEFGRSVVTYDNLEVSNENIILGNIFHMNNLEKNKVDLSKKSLASHTFITGSTGSGKSNTVYKILSELRKNDVKFLVIEPAKGEYKNVFGGLKDVSVYGTNPLITDILRINPFSFPKEIHVLEHLDRLVEIFNVCWPMYAAMPAVLKNAIEKSYIDSGWDLLKSTNKYSENLYPSFNDVVRNIKEIIDSSEFDNDNKGAYKGSLLTRLESLTNGINGIIFTPHEISNEDLFDKNVIVDLSRVGSSETKSLIMGMLVLKLQEYRMNSSEEMNSELKHITVLEEAHNILRRTSTEQSAEGSNLLGKSVEMLANAIAEMRTYGEGFIIADQAPGLMDMSVIRNTNTKIIMRLPDQSDRELVGKSANLNDDQVKELAKLPCGVAAIYQNEWVQPVLCKVDKYNDKGKRFIKRSNIDFKEEKYLKAKITKLLLANHVFEKIDFNKEELCKEIIKSKIESKIKINLLTNINKANNFELKDISPIICLLYDYDKAFKIAKDASSFEEWNNIMLNNLADIENVELVYREAVLQCILRDASKKQNEFQKYYYDWSEYMRGRVL